jgi:hypothetical protein
MEKEKMQHRNYSELVETGSFIGFFAWLILLAIAAVK